MVSRVCAARVASGNARHFSAGWRSLVEVLGPGIAAMLTPYIWYDRADSAWVVTIATGAAVSFLWIGIVFCWNFGLAPFRLWRAAQARIAQLVLGRRIDRQTIERELELCINQGQVLLDSGTPSQGQLSNWYERVLRAVSHAGDGDRAMLENLGPAPGTRGGALELLILGNRIEKLRLIRDRQYSGRERASIGPRRTAGALQRGATATR
jgi:hypothetical protein